MKTNTSTTPTSSLIELILAEINDFESNPVQLSENVYFNQYEKVNELRTHQNEGFLTQLAEGQTDDRQFTDIVSAMVETGIVNMDIDTKNFEPYTEARNQQAHEVVAKSAITKFHNQTTHGVKINNDIETFVDDGNIVARKIPKEHDRGGEIYKQVNLQNLYVIDQTAETLEDTTVIEKEIMNQTTLRGMKSWKRIDDVIKSCNIAKSNKIPYYEVYYRYGEVSKYDLAWTKADLAEEDFEEIEEDKDEYVQALTVMVKAKKGKNEISDISRRGIIVFAEELKPEIIKISKNLKITKYKPYEEAHLGKYNGRWMRKGYREIGIPFQNRANELRNQIRELMKLGSKMVFWSSDEQIAGKNVLSSIDNGQIIQAKDLYLVNNAFPNLSAFADQWNQNIDLLTRALKAFEVATGEKLPGNTTATAAAIQNQRIGQYYDFKREKIGLFFSAVYKRWVLPELMINISMEEEIEIIGDPSYIENYVDAMAEGWMRRNYLKMIAMKGGMITRDMYEQVKEIKKQEILKSKKQFIKLSKDFFKDVEIYVTINTTGESFNKQNRISNGMALLEFITDPEEQRDMIMNIATDLGWKLNLKPRQSQPEMVEQPGRTPANKPKNEQEQELENNQPLI